MRRSEALLPARARSEKKEALYGAIAYHTTHNTGVRSGDVCIALYQPPAENRVGHGEKTVSLRQTLADSHTRHKVFIIRRAQGCRSVRMGRADAGGYDMATHFGGYAAHGRLLEKMYDLLDEEQMRQLTIRMIESRIRAKQHHIELMQYKVETYKMARDMLQAGVKKK